MDTTNSNESDSEPFDQESVKSDDSKNAEIGDEQQRTAIRSELSNMSFEDLVKLKEELGSKVYNEAIFGKPSKNISKKSKTDFKRANKNRPREESSKRQVPFLGAELRKPAKSTTDIRDPRFDEKCGEYSSTAFKTNYSFVNNIRENELKELEHKMKKASEDEKPNLKLVIQRLGNQLREEKNWRLKESIKNEAVKEIQDAKKEGRQPHYATKKELETKQLVKQFEELKNSGRLAKHIEKKRKKNISKDRKKMKID